MWVLTGCLLDGCNLVLVGRFTSLGIRVTFIQSGKFYEFDFSVLLTTLVTSLALLAVSSTLVNLLMTHVLPMKALYKDHKYEVTEDFSHWRDNKESFEREKLLAQQRNAGTLDDTGIDAGAITKVRGSASHPPALRGLAVPSPSFESVEDVAVPQPAVPQPATLSVTEC